MNTSFEEQFITDFCNKIKVEHASKRSIAEQVFEAGYRLEASKEPLTGTGVDGWIDWPANRMFAPVHSSTLVDVMYGDGERAHGVSAGAVVWEGRKTPEEHHKIIAYRLHQPQEAEHSDGGVTSGPLTQADFAQAGITEQDDEANLNDCIGQTPAPVWNGEGLPPVGVEFEYGSHRSRAKCLAHGLHYVFASKGNPDDEESDYEELLIDAGTEYYPVDEERAAIRKVIKAAGITSTYADKIANALIDAGYSKQ